MKRVRAFCVLAALAFCLPAAAADGGDQLTPEQRRLCEQSFDQVWQIVYDRHYDTTFGGVDWPGLRIELRPKLDTCETMADVRVLLAEMIHRLGLSHFEILPGEILSTMDIPDNPVDQAGVTGMVVRVVGGAALVARVRPETPAAEAGIRPGWEVVTAGGDKVTEVLAPLQEQYADHIRYPIYAATAVLNRLAGKVGDTVTATFRDSSGNLVTDSLVLAERVGQRTVFGNLPPFYLTIDTATLEGGIGYFAFNCFFDPGMLMGRFQEFVAAHRDAPGWIIDVRGNPGGIGGIAMGLAGFMVSEKNLLIGTLTTRESNLKMVINPAQRLTTAGSRC